MASVEAIDTEKLLGWTDPERREAFREACVREIPAGYSPLLHFAVPSVVGLGLVAGSLATLRGVSLIEWLTVPAVYLIANAFEWRVHKSMLHKRVAPFGILYDRHTPHHHRIYHTEVMAVRSRQEWILVLLPAWAIVFIALLTVPVALGIGNALGRNVGALYLATAMSYVVSYEWLHLSYHLPDGHPVAKLGVIRWLKRHHARHHDPALMQKYNFNVVVPLWDHVRGTVFRP